MPCSYDSPLTPDQLTAAIDGSANPEVGEHLAHCPDCSARLAEAQQAERRLTHRLHRWDCPSPAQLGEYHLGALPPDSAATITRHLADCDRCSLELAALRQFLAAEAAPASGTARARPGPQPGRLALVEVIAQLLPRATALALRGETTREPIVAEADGVMIILDLQPVGQGRVSVLGQVAAEAQDRWTSALVQLRQSGDLQAMATVSDLGTFQCRFVSPGPTEIRITPVVGPTIVVPNIELTA
jgi:hypothetical protein